MIESSEGVRWFLGFCVKRRIWWFSLAAGVCLLLGMVGYGDAKGAGRPSTKVWLIGWDGMAPWIVEPMMASGVLPNLNRLATGGTVAELESIAPAISPALWTTIATGKPREEHGIESFWEEDPLTGRERLNTSQDRKAAPLWKMLDGAGLRSTVVGWWATWPAERVRGTIVTDRLALSRFDLHPRTAKSEARRRGLVSPPELEPDLRRCLRRPDEIDADELHAFVDGPLLDESSLELHDQLSELRIVFARDEAHWCIASLLLQREPVDLLAMHIQGTDIVNHYFLKYRYPQYWADRHGPIEVEQAERFHDTIEAYYRWQDRRLGEILSLADKQTVVLVVSDHGFRIHPRNQVPTVSGGHMGSPPPPGYLVAFGPGIRAGHRLSSASILDIAPTVLALLELPRARDQPGRVLLSALVDAPEEAWVDSYGDGRETRSEELVPIGDQELIRRLKSVGYVGS